MGARNLGGMLVGGVSILLIGLTGVMAGQLDPADSPGQSQVQLHFFWAATCPHCLEARPFVESIPGRRPWVALHSLELTRHPENARRYEAMARELGQEAVSVPALIFCGEMQVGWQGDATTGARLLKALDECHARADAGPASARESTGASLHLPLFGAMDATRLSLPLMTVAIAALDAFNPCAFFVLFFLLSLMVHQNSRGRMLAIGGIFVLCSGVMYFLFMAAWLNLFTLLGHLAWVTLAAGILAVLMGGINIKDFFALGQGVSLSIPESKKPDIYRRARAILATGSLPAMMVATLVLAVAANFYELLCTAGFPMVYTRLLTLSGQPPLGRYLYLALYNLVYVIPLGIIVLTFVRTMGARRLTEREGRLLKLLSGLMMLELGLLLVLAPAMLSSLPMGLGLVVLAVVLTWLVARLTRTA